MKKIFIIIFSLIVVAGVFSCRKKGEKPREAKLETELLKDTTKIEFLDTTTYWFDTIAEGDLAKHTFRIKNTGDKNFVIANAFGSCGCTVPEYPKEPVKPGETAEIHVTFNSSGKPNEISKTVTLVCNTANRNELLYMKGFVKKKE